MSLNSIHLISETLRKRLQDGIQVSTGVDPALTTASVDKSLEVLLGPPSISAVTTSKVGNYVSLWLYQVTPDEFSRNRAAQPVGETKLHQAPLRLNLHYLITPVCDTHEQEILALERTMRWLNDHAVFSVHDSTAGYLEKVSMGIGVADLDGLTRIWEAIRETYRLSIGYLVRTARIESTVEQSVARIKATQADFADPLPASGDAS